MFSWAKKYVNSFELFFRRKYYSYPKTTDKALEDLAEFVLFVNKNFSFRTNIPTGKVNYFECTTKISSIEFYSEKNVECDLKSWMNFYMLYILQLNYKLQCTFAEELKQK